MSLHKIKSNLKNERGMALVVVLGTITLLLLFVAFQLFHIRTTHTQINKTGKNIDGRQMASMGIDHMRIMVKGYADEAGDPAVVETNLDFDYFLEKRMKATENKPVVVNEGYSYTFKEVSRIEKNIIEFTVEGEANNDKAKETSKIKLE